MKAKKEIAAWCFYDFANSSFATIILTVGFGVFFKETVCGGGGRGDLFWGLSLGIAYTLVAISSPILGAISDERGSRKKYLIILTLLSVTATALLSFLGPGMIMGGMFLFILGFFGFAVGNVLYNAFLPEISNPKTLGRISGLGWAFGYVGGLASLGLCYPWISTEQFKITFGLTSLFFLIFSIPAFIFLKTPPKNLTPTFIQSFKKGLCRLNTTRLEISKHKELWKFFMAFFFFNDSLSTVITFSSIYAHDTFKMDMKEISSLFIFLQISAFLGALGSGFFVDRIGAKKTILGTLWIWIFTVLAMYFSQTKTQFWVIALIAGLGLGSSQSAARSFVALMTPSGKAGEFFGFYAIFTKLSSILGPLTFGLASYLLASQRKAVLTLLFFFILGAVLLTRVKDERSA